MSNAFAISLELSDELAIRAKVLAIPLAKLIARFFICVSLRSSAANA
jgi:hypothetical protein